MINALVVLGSLNLPSLKIEETIEVCDLIVSLAISNTPSTILLRDSIKLLQIEVAINKPILEVQYGKYRSIVIKCWV